MRALALLALATGIVVGCGSPAPPDDDITKNIPDANGAKPPPPPGGAIGPDGRAATPSAGGAKAGG